MIIQGVSSSSPNEIITHKKADKRSIALSKKINKEILERVNSTEHPFTDVDLQNVRNFASSHQVTIPSHVSKNASGLKRSLFLVPQGTLFNGAYILCKGKGEDETPKGLPLGGTSRATIAINIKTGEKMVCKSGLYHVGRSNSAEESIVDMVNRCGMQYVLGGVAIHYAGKIPESVKDEKRIDKGKRDCSRLQLTKEGNGLYKKVAYLMPFCEKGDLFGQPDNEKRTLGYIKDIAHGIKECHNCGIAHYDIKPENIFLKGERAFLADLDRAGFRTNLNKKPKFPASSGFIAPEFLQQRLNKQPLPVDYDVFANDLWQFGVLIADKFYGGTFVKFMTEIEKGNSVNLNTIEQKVEQLKKISNVPPIVPKVISQLLNVDPKKRGTIDEIVRLLDNNPDPICTVS